MTSTERVRQHRKKLKQEGLPVHKPKPTDCRLDTFISSDAMEQLQRLKVSHGVTLRTAMERLLMQVDAVTHGETPEDKVLHLVRDGHHGKARKVISLYRSNSAAYAAIQTFSAFEHPYRDIHLCKTDIGRTLANLQNCISATKAKLEKTIDK